jgi:hypothetical protein
MKLVDLDRNKLKKAAKRDRDRTFQIERGVQLESTRQEASTFRQRAECAEKRAITAEAELKASEGVVGKLRAALASEFETTERLEKSIVAERFERERLSAVTIGLQSELTELRTVHQARVLCDKLRIDQQARRLRAVDEQRPIENDHVSPMVAGGACGSHGNDT